MIRNMQTRDSQRVMQLWLNGNLQAHNFIPAKFWESNAPSVYEQLLQADGYVYEADGEILGFAGMQGNYLAGIFVDVRSRSLGIGKKLLSHIKSRYPAFFLHVYQANRRAVAFYQREGLSIASAGPEEATGEPDFVMTWG